MTQLRTVLAIVLAVATPAAAQLGVPPIGPVVDRVGDVLPRTLDASDTTVRSASSLVQARLERLTSLVRRNRDVIARDENGDPARRGEVVMLDADDASIATAQRAGFAMIEQDRIDGIDVAFARLSTPRSDPLDKAVRRLRKLLPGKTITADQLYFRSGGAVPQASSDVSAGSKGGTVGLIDGGVGGGIRVVEARSFAGAAPTPDAHGTAVASLLTMAGVDRILSADVYGSDRAGGNALAIARALGWMTARRVPVVNISLVGPANPLLERACAAAATRGTIVVAAVGNDGAASPLAYPASYPNVVAVTGVDRRNRVLIEAGRALHLDYAAPGADIVASRPNGVTAPVRGTSFAAPLVAARIAAAYGAAPSRAALFARIDTEAVDLGAKGADRIYGRGLLCGECRTKR